MRAVQLRGLPDCLPPTAMACLSSAKWMRTTAHTMRYSAENTTRANRRDLCGVRSSLALHPIGGTRRRVEAAEAVQSEYPVLTSSLHHQRAVPRPRCSLAGPPTPPPTLPLSAVLTAWRTQLWRVPAPLLPGGRGRGRGRGGVGAYQEEVNGLPH
jgi:hypothetical protein